MVFIKEEVENVLSNLHGVYWFVANLLYGSGLRLLECLRLRVKDIDFDYSILNELSTKVNDRMLLAYGGGKDSIII